MGARLIPALFDTFAGAPVTGHIGACNFRPSLVAVGVAVDAYESQVVYVIDRRTFKELTDMPTPRLEDYCRLLSNGAATTNRIFDQTFCSLYRFDRRRCVDSSSVSASASFAPRPRVHSSVSLPLIAPRYVMP